MLMISVCTVGCMNKQQTKEEIYDDFKDQISNISSYTCTANVEAIGNKENTTYVFKHTYKKPDYYKLEVILPKNLKGKTIEYKDDKVLVHNPDINDTIELPNINDVSYMFYNCAKLDVDLSNWDLSNLQNSLKLEIVNGSGITENHYPKLT